MRIKTDVLQRLYEARHPRRGRRLESAPIFAREAKEVRRVGAGCDQVLATLQSNCPEYMASVRGVQIARGVLTIRVGDSATTYRLSQALRSGLERTIMRECKSGLRRVTARM